MAPTMIINRKECRRSQNPLIERVDIAADALNKSKFSQSHDKFYGFVLGKTMSKPGQTFGGSFVRRLATRGMALLRVPTAKIGMRRGSIALERTGEEGFFHGGTFRPALIRIDEIISFHVRPAAFESAPAFACLPRRLCRHKSETSCEEGERDERDNDGYNFINAD